MPTLRVRSFAFALAPFLIGCGGEPDASGESDACSALHLQNRGDVRAFVVGHKVLLEDSESYSTFEASYRQDFEAIAPCLSKTRPNLVVFPENAALGAFLIGSRGAPARQATSSTAAFVQIWKQYSVQQEYYKARVPSAGLRRQILLALTDVTWRAFERTFAGIARGHGVWVMANADVAPAKETTDPDLVAKLGDPEADDPSTAYVADGDAAFNSAYLFAPDGSLSGRVDKVFLTDAEETDLDLANGSFPDLKVLETPFARIGVATSRDAFYPPFMQRLEDRDVDLVIQPEAFSGWTIEELPGDWLPDVFLASGWLHTQKSRTFRYSLNSVYTGNFFELAFDGQSHVTERARPDAKPSSYVGQEPIVGFSRVGPWVEPDPRGPLSLDERRAKLRETGQALLPGSGAPNENGYVSSLIAADLVTTRTPIELERDTSLPESVRVSPSEGGDQRCPDVVTTSALDALVVWQDTRSGLSRIRFATSNDGGKSYVDRGEIDPGNERQIRPSLCGSGADVALVWQEGDAHERVRAARFSNGSFQAPLDVVPSASAAQWAASCGFTGAGQLLVVWTDFASGVPKISGASLGAGATAFGAPFSLDASTAAAPRLDGSQVEPAVSETGGHVVWLDYRNRSWDVYATRFDGNGVLPAKRLDGPALAGDPERLHGEPRISADAGQVVVAWSDLRDRRGHADIAYVVSSDQGATWSDRNLVPGGTGSGLSVTSGGSAMPRYRPEPLVSGGSFQLIFQDLTPNKSAIFRAQALASGLATSEPTRIDDSGASAVSATRPRAAQAGTATLVVWEDDRDGAYRIVHARIE